LRINDEFGDYLDSALNRSLMSALGQKQTSDCRRLISVIHPKAGIEVTRLNVRSANSGRALQQIVWRLWQSKSS
jgi:hypothetical protein